MARFTKSALKRGGVMNKTDVKLKELLEELSPKTSVQMLKWKLEFWNMKHSGVEYDSEKLAIVKMKKPT